MKRHTHHNVKLKPRVSTLNISSIFNITKYHVTQDDHGCPFRFGRLRKIHEKRRY